MTLTMKVSMRHSELANQLGKEFWGILLFEWSLPALHEYLNFKSIAIGLNRFADWVLFPEKLSSQEQERLLQKLNERDSDDPRYTGYTMSATENHIHQIIREVLTLKYSHDSLDPSTLHEFYTVPPDVFFYLSIQLVERGWISGQYMCKLYRKYQQIREGSVE
jgi:hypothetical protein